MTSEIEIRMPTTETDDKRIQIFNFSVRKAERRKLDILLFAVCINMVLKNPPNMPILALKYSQLLCIKWKSYSRKTVFFYMA